MVAAVSLGVAAAGYGGAAEAAETSSTAVVEIMTVPAVAGARFVFDNVTYRADRNGVVRLDIAKGTRRHTISVADVKINERTRDLAFVRWWYPGHHDQDYLKALTGIRIRKNLRIKAAFRATYLVHYSFTDEARSAVNRDRVSRLEFFGDNGHTVSGTGAGKIRLVGIRPVVNAGTILAKPVRYRVQRVDVDGSNVVQVNQQAFVPSQEASVVVPLLLRTAHFSTRDLLFGGPVGRSVRLTYPDGRRATVALNADGNATLEELARGRYSVSVDAAGYSFLRPVVLSRNQYIDLPVLTYLDIGVVGGAAAMLAGALYLFRLANRRSRVRAVPLVT